MAISSTFLTVASLAFTAFSTITEMSAQRDAGKAAQRQAEANAAYQENEAARAEAVGAHEAAALRKKTEAQLATQRAIRAGTGGDTSTGSALLVAEDLAEEGEYNALLAENNADLSASAQRQQANITRMGGANAAAAGRTRGATRCSPAVPPSPSRRPRCRCSADGQNPDSR